MKTEKHSYVYILANDKNGAIYIGVTNNIIRRIQEHKEKTVKGFTEQYDVDKLVYYEVHGSIGSAIYKEKQLKKWKREWKVALIEKDNYEWSDLHESLF